MLWPAAGAVFHFWLSERPLVAFRGPTSFAWSGKANFWLHGALQTWKMCYHCGRRRKAPFNHELWKHVDAGIWPVVHQVLLVVVVVAISTADGEHVMSCACLLEHAEVDLHSRFYLDLLA